MNDISKQRLLTRLGCSFNDQSLFDLALTHRSCGAKNNERLEFLGDSILGFVIGEALYQKFPDAKEGQLSRLRSQLVKGETLAEIAREFELGDCLNLGEGEMKSGGFRRASILADAVEAIIGAVYMDQGMEAAKGRILNWYQPRLEGLVLADNPKDPKTELQEFLQARRAPLPEYDVISVAGDAHAQQFTVVCRTSLLKEPTQAQASSRRAAEKLAAAAALKALQG
ncbi:ribonuclease III [Maricurvus nonylphenolicus]|uniref:ribonuclease III n=1 Tax=Maricurvus nonylphenolicus TaxID=1008307 RepID=UPI0036F323FA